MIRWQYIWKLLYIITFLQNQTAKL